MHLDILSNILSKFFIIGRVRGAVGSPVPQHGYSLQKVIFGYSFYYTQEKLFLKHTTRTFRFLCATFHRCIKIVFAALYRQPLTALLIYLFFGPRSQTKNKCTSLQRYYRPAGRASSTMHVLVVAQPAEAASRNILLAVMLRAYHGTQLIS